MAMYQNFLLSEKNFQYKRIAYTFLDVLGYVGGVLEIGGMFICFIIIPFKYNLTKVRLLMDYLPSHHEKVRTTQVTFSYFINDFVKATGFKFCNKLIMRDFDYMKDIMDTISGRFLELSN